MSKTLQELLDDANSKLLEASVEAASLRTTIAARDRRIAELEGTARRATLPFKRDQTKRIGEDNERYRADMQAAGRGHLLR